MNIFRGKQLPADHFLINAQYILNIDYFLLFLWVVPMNFIDYNLSRMCPVDTRKYVSK